MTNELVVLVTTSTSDDAYKIADALVAERLAGCVNIIPAIESVYRWEGKVTRDTETLMIIKTTSERYPEVERRVKELHTYSTPEVVALRIERGSEQYLNWVRDATANDETR